MPLPSDSDIYACLKEVYDTHQKNVKKFVTDDITPLTDHTIDPLNVICQMGFGGLSPDQWRKFEQGRRIEKALSNSIGRFHERLLAKVPGWAKPRTGFDVRNEARKIIAEVKNKYNTMNSTAHLKTLENMEEFLRQNAGWTIYLVQIVPKDGRMDEPLHTPGRRGNEKIRCIDGASFYDLATTEGENSLYRIYERFPEIIKQLDKEKELPRESVEFFREIFERCYNPDVFDRRRASTPEDPGALL